MKKNLVPIIALTIIVGLFTGVNSTAAESRKAVAVPIPIEQRVFSPVHDFLAGDHCEIINDDGIPAYQSTSFDSGMGLVAYMDPAKCGVADPYPFQVTQVHLCLFGPLSSEYAWPVSILVAIRDVSGSDKCNGPDSILSSEAFFDLPSDSGYSNMANLTLSQPVDVSGPFFVEVMYLTRKTVSSLPSLLMDEAVPDTVDTCDNWFHDTDGFHDWVSYWGLSPLLGDPFIRAAGQVNSEVYDSCWYWKPDTTGAPSGMPDFSQYQFPDSAAMCGPTAVANCLWWFDAVREEYKEDPPGFIRYLSGYFHTRADSGTNVDSMQAGLERYFGENGFLLQPVTFTRPDFYEMAESLKTCQDVILLLGFWQLDDEWKRVGGHFVTMAGVCTESVKVALSDPGRDAALEGWQGRVRPAGEHPPSPVDDTLHNHAEFACHDMYWALIEAFPAGSWRLVFYQDFQDVTPFVGQNFQPGQDPVTYNPAQPIHTWVEYAMMICPKPSAVPEQEESTRPRDYRLFQNQPNPFNAQTVIRYRLDKTCPVRLTVYNLLGERVATLVEETQGPGLKTVTWQGTDGQGRELASGVYLYELKAGGITETKRMVLLK